MIDMNSIVISEELVKHFAVLAIAFAWLFLTFLISVVYELNAWFAYGIALILSIFTLLGIYYGGLL